MGTFSTFTLVTRHWTGSETPKVSSTSIPRPAAAEQPDDGIMRIRGSGSQIVNLSHSMSDSYSRQVVKETRRTYDLIRIKNPDNESQFVDVQRPFKTNMQTQNTRGFIDPYSVDFWTPYVTTVYARQPELDNVEILDKNIKLKNPDYNR